MMLSIFSCYELAIYKFFGEILNQKSFVHFFIDMVKNNSLYILDICPLSDILKCFLFLELLV